ncbi:hypothetical protein TNCV_4213931 [Trichonephila clavipes]|nr:hypothetical protein TNCV_4213931 [Trichonephila clavipes]
MCIRVLRKEDFWKLDYKKKASKRDRPKPIPTIARRQGINHSGTVKNLEKLYFVMKVSFAFQVIKKSTYVRRHIYKEFSLQCLKDTLKYSTKMMIEGSMSSRFVGRIHNVRTGNASEYCRIIQNKLLSSAGDLFGDQSPMFQGNNDRYYFTNVVQKWLEDNTVDRMIWQG